jgi:anti-sigma factor RsiW
MSCEKMETRILAYVDGRLKDTERAEMDKHLGGCSACRVRVNEFRAVTDLLDELPVIEPSGAFNARVHALIAAEPEKRRGWLAWFTLSPRIAFAASMLLLLTVWIGSMQGPKQPQIADQDLPVVENADYDVISSFSPLSDLSQAPDDDASDNDASQPQQPQQM